jgi:RimJ/RimL family protein N-acetyltransferase
MNKYLVETEALLFGNHVHLEPLDIRHAQGLISAATTDISLYQWSPVPQGEEEVYQYIQTALSWRDAGTAVPFAIIRVKDGAVIGSTRFFKIEKWAWSPHHPRYGHPFPDACEIGYTWLTSSAIRTGANTEAKMLLLKLAFEKWKVFRVCLHTDVRNIRSRTAIERIGGKFEGILRSHRLAMDQTPRDSARFSIIASEWPDVKKRLERLLDRK